MSVVFELIVGIFLELFVQVIARAVGVTIVATFHWVASGLSISFGAQWSRLFGRYSGHFEWVDVVGIITLALVGVGVWLAVAGVA